MTGYCIDIPFEPHAKRSPIFVRNNRSPAPIIVDPDRARKADLVNWIAENCQLPEMPILGPIEINMIFRVLLPPYLSKKERDKRLSLKWAADNKKDLDNMQKLYQDILNHGKLKGKYFDDDHQIVYCKTHKIWSTTPGVFIYLREIDEPFCSCL